MGTEHRHEDGLIRGRLEWRLNKAYGLIEQVADGDDELLLNILKALAEFHTNPPAITALGEKRYGLIGFAKQKKVMKYGPPSSQKGNPK